MTGVFVQPDIALDILYSAICPGGDRLSGSPGKPVDYTSPGYEAQYGIGVKQVENLLRVNPQHILYNQDQGENHGGGANYRGTYQHRFGSGFEGIAGPVVGFQIMLGFVEIGFKAEFFLNLFVHILDLFDQGQFVNGLRVVSYRAIAVHRNGHRSHPQHTEGYQAESEDGGIAHYIAESESTEIVGHRHQGDEHHADPEGAEVAGYHTGEDV